MNEQQSEYINNIHASWYKEKNVNEIEKSKEIQKNCKHIGMKDLIKELFLFILHGLKYLGNNVFSK